MPVSYSPIDPATANFVDIGPADFSNGERRIIEIDGQAIAIFNIAGSYYAIADVCSHDDGPVAEGDLLGYEIECPRHGAHFDVRTGKVLSFPAIVDIPSYPVKIEGGELSIGLPPEG
jgi:3-phenylpropionate/trans-cinnamate dioxygenase ferredoxin subunit